tara:strand:+ start:237 stop:437 length:201 start_codon:yes stop_codon:yes gene_type:complete
MKINVYDHETGKVIERKMTPDELANYELIQAEAEKEAQAEIAKAEAKKALLTKLGITTDEAALLLS